MSIEMATLSISLAMLIIAALEFLLMLTLALDGQSRG